MSDYIWTYSGNWKRNGRKPKRYWINGDGSSMSNGPAERTNGTFGSGAFCSDSWRAALRFLCERLSPTTQRELKCNEPMRQIWVFDARSPMGPRIATPVAAIEWAAALGHRRLYPIGD